MDRELYIKSMKNITSIDGRHRDGTKELMEYFSEFALHKYRVYVELKHLIHMSKTDGFNLQKLTLDDEEKLLDIFNQFNDCDAAIIADYDHFGRNGIGPFEHDVKSVEYFLREKLTGKYDRLIPMIHYALTSEDVNNLAYNCMIRDCLDKIWTPKLVSVMDKLKDLSLENKLASMLGRTHGQPASPTTFGKEMAVYLKRFTNELQAISNIRLNGKLNGAVGNYNAMVAGSPKVDWIRYSKEFVESFGFDCELLTCQRGPKNKISELFQSFIRVNNILKDFDIDMWLYISNNYVIQKPVASHVGSSVMPHKVNPWQLECSEGALEIANALLESYVREIEVSRLQRDLSDHEHERSYGTGIAYSCVALDYVDKFLDKVYVNKDVMLADLENNKQILSEAFQTILRAEGVHDAYEIFKDAFRGKTVDESELNRLIDALNITREVKDRLRTLDVKSYIGLSSELTEFAVLEYNRVKAEKISKTYPTLWVIG